MRLNDPNEISDNVLRMILKKMISDGITFDDMETVYGTSATPDQIDDVLKLFGITDIEYEDYGFFAKLYMDNLDNLDNSEIKLKRSTVKEYYVMFEVDVRKRVSEFYKLPINSYCESFIKDMIYNGDISYYDGEFIDDDVIDSETDDWNITDIKPVIRENKSKKNILENVNRRKIEVERLIALKEQIEKRINFLSK